MNYKAKSQGQTQYECIVLTYKTCLYSVQN